MYDVCIMIITYSRIWINLLVRMPISILVSLTGKKIDTSLTLFAPDNLVPRDGISRLVPREPAHSPHSG